MFHFQYAPFLTVTVSHPYYVNKISNDLDLMPLPSASLLLDAYRLRIRNVSGQLIAYQERDAGNQPVLELDSVIDIFFVLRVKTDLLNITETFGSGKYWFSNLREDGSYQIGLMTAALLSAGDELPPISPQQKTLNFLPGVYSSVVVQRIVAGAGWQTVQTIPIDASANSIQLDIPRAGLYRLRKMPSGGGNAEESKWIFSDELSAMSNVWSVMHLQLKKGDNNLNFTIGLNSRQSTWQYYLVEPKTRTTVLDPNTLLMKYTIPPNSRYPANVNMDLINPANYSDQVKQYVASVMEDSSIRQVYLFQSAAKLSILDGLQPQLKITSGGQDMVSKVTIPARSMQNTITIYKL